MSYVIEWTRTDPKRGTIRGYRHRGPDEDGVGPLVFADKRSADSECARLNERTTAYEYHVVKKPKSK